MNFMEKFFMIMLISRIGFSWEIDYKDIQSCACSQHLWKPECDYKCDWDDDSNTCQEQKKESCSLLVDKDSCKSKDYCQYNVKTKTCEDFKTCEEVPFLEKLDCWNSKPGCEYYESLGKCSKFDCSKFQDEECPYYHHCYIKDGKCRDFTCDQYSALGCLSSERCTVEDDVCRPSTCQDQTISTCYFIQNIENHTFQPCIVEGDKCVEAKNVSQFTTPYDCFIRTVGAYHWSTADEKNGKCISCSDNPNPPAFEIVLKVAIGLLIIIN